MWTIKHSQGETPRLAGNEGSDLVINMSSQQQDCRTSALDRETPACLPACLHAGEISSTSNTGEEGEETDWSTPAPGLG